MSDKRMFKTIAEQYPEELARQRLEAVAPDLLEALKHIEKYGKHCDVVFIARQAIAKAEGK